MSTKAVNLKFCLALCGGRSAQQLSWSALPKQILLFSVPLCLCGEIMFSRDRITPSR